MEIKYQKLSDFAICPSKNTEADAGYDLYSTEPALIRPMERRLISTGISILNLFGMLLVYNRDPELAANKAERRRSTALSLKIGQFPTTTRQKIKNYLNSVKKIILNKNCRYLIISQRYLLENYSKNTI